MKKLYIFLIFLLILPCISAEIDEIYLEKALSINNQIILNEFDIRQDSTEQKINDKVRDLEDKAHNSINLALFKLGLVIVTSIFIGFLACYSFYIWVKKIQMKIISKKFKIIRGDYNNDKTEENAGSIGNKEILADNRLKNHGFKA